MGATKEIPLPHADSHNAAFAEFKHHTSGQRVVSDFAVLELLRKTHPEYHVTTVDPKNCALLEFANAGKATATLNPTDDAFNATRTWQPVGTGTSKKSHPGELTDHIRFAQYTYTWDSRDFLLYETEWTDMLRPPTKLFYILSPRPSTSGHSPATDALLLAAGKWSSALHSEIYVFDNAHWTKSKALWTAVHGSTWDSVILDAAMKQSLISDVLGFFDAQPLYSELAVPWKRGIILHGVPGNGKTISIKALMCALYARDIPIPSLYVKSFENCKGPQASIQSIFAQARASAPCLLVFEDLDSLVQDESRSYFLNEVDGLDDNEGILMVGSTNHLERLDPAIARRPSRFDRKYWFKVPGVKEREAYAAYWKRKLEGSGAGGRVEFPEGLCRVVGALTEGFSFAYLKELFVMALLTVARGGVVVDADENEEKDDKETKGEAAPAEHGNPWAEERKKDETTPNDSSEVPETETACTCCKAHVQLRTQEVSDTMKQPTANDAVNNTKNTREIPDVEIPPELRDNAFLRVIKHQIKILLAEMDNTAEEEWSSEKAPKQDRGRVPRRGECL
ncbi:proteasome-activating nucleotidase [Lophium mytilinum]|uniref:Proteasome-activating nucleotidase n=1 Tax=Lophium mytilinum TaxID=390894 RepID=A0A6A6QTR9_9PEZI|nr:proteasome-activating nucleotidase [Lophium mytilinum]